MGTKKERNNGEKKDNPYIGLPWLERIADPVREISMSAFQKLKKLDEQMDLIISSAEQDEYGRLGPVALVVGSRVGRIARDIILDLEKNLPGIKDLISVEEGLGFLGSDAKKINTYQTIVNLCREEFPSLFMSQGIRGHEIKAPLRWVQEDREVHAIEVWERLFFKKVKNFTPEELSFLFEYFILHMEQESQASYQQIFPLYRMFPLLAEMSAGFVESLLEEEDVKVAPVFQEKNLIQNFYTFVNQMMEAILNAENPLHSEAVLFFLRGKEIVEEIMSDQIKEGDDPWFRSFAQGIISRDFSMEGRNLVEAIQMLEELDEESEYSFYSDFKKKIIKEASRISAGNAIYFPEIRGHFSKSDNSLQEAKQAFGEVFWVAKENFEKDGYTGKINFDFGQEIDDFIQNFLAEGHQFKDFNIFIDFTEKTVFYNIYIESSNSFRKISFLIQMKGEEPQILIHTIDDDDALEQDQLDDLKATLFSIVAGILDQYGQRVAQDKASAPQPAQETQKTVQVARKKRKKTAKSTIPVEFPQGLVERARQEKHRPSLVLPDEFLRSIKDKSVAAFIKEKVAYFNEGGLSFRKLRKPDSDGRDRFRIRVGDHRLLAHLEHIQGEDKLVVYEMIKRREDTYR